MINTLLQGAHTCKLIRSVQIGKDEQLPGAPKATHSQSMHTFSTETYMHTRRHLVTCLQQRQIL